MGTVPGRSGKPPKRIAKALGNVGAIKPAQQPTAERPARDGARLVNTRQCSAPLAVFGSAAARARFRLRYVMGFALAYIFAQSLAILHHYAAAAWGGYEARTDAATIQ